MTAPSDLADLLAKVAAKDRAAFAALYRATSAKLYGVVARILPSGEASEVLQEVYVKIWERAADFDPDQVIAGVDADVATVQGGGGGRGELQRRRSQGQGHRQAARHLG